MAKSKSFWGLRRGSAGSLTFSKSSKGEQITRAKITSMKNPQTVGQNIQRMTFAGVSKARKRWNEIVNHSFQGETPKITSLSEFTRRNLKFAAVKQLIAGGFDFDLTPMAADTPSFPVAYKEGAALPTKLIISQGSLPSRQLLFTAGAQGGPNLVDSLLSFEPGEAGAVPTFSDLFAQAGIAVGDWLTFCCEMWDAGVGSISEDFVYTTWVRFKVISGGYEVPATIANMAQVFEVEQGGDNIDVSYGLMTVGSRRGVGIYVPAMVGNVISLVALIHSRDTESSRLRSDAVLNFWFLGGLANDLAEAYTNAVASWQIGNSYILDGGQDTYASIQVPNWYEYQAQHGVPRPRPVRPAEGV